MAGKNLSRFLQHPVNTYLFKFLPPGLSRSYMRGLGRIYFTINKAERERYETALWETFHPKPFHRDNFHNLRSQVFDGVSDHYYEKLLTAYWGFPRMRRLLLRQVQLVNRDLLNQALAQGQGVLLATGHFGAVEFLPAALSLRGYPTTMVVAYKTPKLKKTLEQLARQANLELIDRDEADIVSLAIGALKAGRIFIIELDEIKHWRPNRHQMMTFFGQRVYFDRTIEVLQRRSKAQVLLGLVKRTGRHRYQLIFETPVEHHPAPIGVSPAARLLKRLEHYIYDYPDHWYLWKDLALLERFVS